MLLWRCQLYSLLVIVPWVTSVIVPKVTSELTSCQRDGLKYLIGDALSQGTGCVGPDGQPYPSAAVSSFVRANRSPRTGRSYDPPNPLEIQRRLLSTFEAANSLQSEYGVRQERSVIYDNESYLSDSSSRTRPTRCNSEPGGRLCKTKYNTTAPLYGVSLTSGQPVTIVQKFPDLLQQVIFEVCESKECDVLRGECVQTYVPYLFLVIPLGPVTLTGQDYVLVESGCVCKPRFGSQSNEPNIADAIPGFV